MLLYMQSKQEFTHKRQLVYPLYKANFNPHVYATGFTKARFCTHTHNTTHHILHLQLFMYEQCSCYTFSGNVVGVCNIYNSVVHDSNRQKQVDIAISKNQVLQIVYLV